MEWRLPAQLPWQLQVQHLKITMVIGLLPMGNGNELACQQVPLRDQPDPICPLVGLALVMEMENAEDVRGSQPRQQVVLAVQPYTGGLWQG